MSRKDGDRIRLLDGDSSSSHHGGSSAGGGPGVNRLGDLLGGAPLPPPAEIHVAIDKHQSPAVVSMNEFMEDISTLKAAQKQFSDKIALIEKRHAAIITSTGGSDSIKEQAELGRLMDDVNETAQRIKTRLTNLDAAIKEKAPSDSDANARIKRTLHASSQKKFMDSMGHYQSVQTKYKDMYRERVERQYKTVNPHATQQQVNEVLEGDGSAIFATMSVGALAAKDALADIQEKHRDIKKLERSIASPATAHPFASKYSLLPQVELAQLFQDMAILVESQGELINSIDNNVSLAKDYVEDGNKELVEAQEYQKSSRKKIFIIACIIAVIIGLFIGIYYITK